MGEEMEYVMTSGTGSEQPLKDLDLPEPKPCLPAQLLVYRSDKKKPADRIGNGQPVSAGESKKVREKRFAIPNVAFDNNAHIAKLLG